MVEYDFAFSDFVKRQYGFGSEKRASDYQNLICKHWLRGLCKKGASCDFSHEYNLRAMPECTHYARQGICPNGEACTYVHKDPFFKEAPCSSYENGHCPLGPYCAKRHVRKKSICKCYLAGFCPDGKDCKQGAHPVWHEKEDLEKPQVRIVLTKEEEEQRKEQLKEQLMQKMDREQDEDGREDRPGYQAGFRGNRGGRGRKQWGGGGGRSRKQF